MGQRREAISVQPRRPAWWAWRRAWGHSEQSRSWTRHLPLFRFIHSLTSTAVGAHPVCRTIGELDPRPGFRKLDVPWSRESPQGGLLAWRPWVGQGGGGVSPVTGSIRETSWRRRHPKRPCKCILRALGGLIIDTGAGWGPGRLTWYSLTDFFFFS